MAVQLTRRRFTVDEYYWMARVGILGEDDRVQLIDGEIVEMPPIGPEHAGTVSQFSEGFTTRYTDAAQVRVQNPIRLDEYNEPEPDVALVRRRADFYRLAHPSPADVFLVVEVADTTLAADRGVKMPLYARFGIPEAWLIDVRHQVVLVYREPTSDGYRVVATARPGERIAPLAFPDREIEVADLFG